MGKLINEFVVFFSLKTLRYVCFLIFAYSFLMNGLAGINAEQFLFAPSIIGIWPFASLFGPLNVFLVAQVWDQDLRRGTIKNILSAGVSRENYFFRKLFMVVTQSVFLSLYAHVIGLFQGIIRMTAGGCYSGGEGWRSQVFSLLCVFFISVAYSSFATFLFMAVMSFRLALLIAVSVSFLESVLSVVFLAGSEVILSPNCFFIMAVQRAARMDLGGIELCFQQGMATMLIYVCIFGIASFIVCKRSEY